MDRPFAIEPDIDRAEPGLRGALQRAAARCFVSDELAAAYRASLYEIAGGMPALLRLTDAPGEHDAWLDALGKTSALVITACNPFSVRCPDAVNEAAQARLARAARSAGLPVVPACGRDAQGPWAEPSWCVFDAPAERIDAWLLEFGQNAALRLERGASPVLVWHPRLRGGPALAPGAGRDAGCRAARREPGVRDE